jgi:hypothetical protein
MHSRSSDAEIRPSASASNAANSDPSSLLMLMLEHEDHPRSTIGVFAKVRWW